MQPGRHAARQIPMLHTLAGLLVASVVLVGCGSESADDGDRTATDPTPEASSPTAPPTVGTYPEFAPEDYTYLLSVSCFCPDANAPIRVTVVDDEVTAAVYAAGGRGITAGEPAPRHRWVTLDQVIAAANDTEAARVDVVWPAGQDYPTSVTVDRDTRAADEEVGLYVSDVVVG